MLQVLIPKMGCLEEGESLHVPENGPSFEVLCFLCLELPDDMLLANIRLWFTN